MRSFTLLAFGLAIVVSAFGQSQRTVLLEHFTQASCGPCATYNPAVETRMNNRPDKIIAIKYQTSWPGYDPMHDHNPADPNARVSYYGINSVPNSVLDGNTYNGHPSGWNESNIDARYAVPSPIDIDINHYVTKDSVYVTVEITPTVDTAILNLVLHTVITEKEITFESAPGSNGEKAFYDVVKKMLPNSNGTLLPDSFKIGETYTYNFQWKFANVYDLSAINVIAFVQNNDGKSVLQAAKEKSTIPFQLVSDKASASTFVGGLDTAVFTVNLTANNDSAANYQIAIDKTALPAGFTSSFEYNGYEYNDSVLVSLAANGSAEVIVTIITSETLNAKGLVNLQFSNVDTFDFYVKSVPLTAFGKANYIFVDLYPLGGSAAFKLGLASAAQSYIELTPSQFNSIDKSELTSTDVFGIVFNCGFYSLGLSTGQIDQLQSYLETGGNLYITGQSIAYNASSTLNFTKMNFILDYMGASFKDKGNNNQQVAVTTMVDNVFNDLKSANLRQVNGAQPDIVNSIGPNSIGFAYYNYFGDKTDYAGVRNNNDTWKVVYFPFMMETFSTNFGYSVFASKSIELSNKWFRGEIGGVDFDAMMQQSMSLYPNPVTSSSPLSVQFELDAPKEVNATIFDITGKKIASHYLGNFNTGVHVTSLPISLEKGSYVVELTVGDKHAVRKLNVQ